MAMAAVDATRLGGNKSSARRQRPKLKAHRSKLTEHIHSSIVECDSKSVSAYASLSESIVPSLLGSDYFSLSVAPLSKVIKQKSKPKVEKAKPKPKPAAKVVVKPTPPVAETSPVPVQSNRPDECIVQGFIGLIQSGNVRQAKSYIRYSTETHFSNKMSERETIRQAEQDFVRGSLDELKKVCMRMEPRTPYGELGIPYSVRKTDHLWDEHNGPPIAYTATKLCESWERRGDKLHYKGKKAIQYNQSQPARYVDWLEKHTPIQRKDGTPLACNISSDKYVITTITEPVPVMIGNLQVGVDFVKKQVSVPVGVSLDVKAKAIAARRNSLASRWGDQFGGALPTVPYHPVADYSGVLTAEAANDEVDVPWHETQFMHLVQEQRKQASLEYEQYKREQHLIDAEQYYEMLMETQRIENLRRHCAASLSSVNTSMAVGPPKPAEVNLQDVGIVVTNPETGVSLTVSSEEEAAVLAELSYWAKAEKKIQEEDRKEFLHKFAIARRMQCVNEAADELNRYYGWLQMREEENSVKTDHVRYEEYWDERSKLDPHGAIAASLMYMEMTHPSFTKDSGEKCYTCKKSHYKHRISQEAEEFRLSKDPPSTGASPVTVTNEVSKAGVRSSPTLTEPLPINQRLILPDKESESSIFKRHLTLSQEEIDDHFQLLTKELRSKVTDLNVVRRLVKYFKESDNGLLVPV